MNCFDDRSSCLVDKYMLIHGGEGIKQHLAIDVDALTRALNMNSSLADPAFPSSSVLSDGPKNHDLSGKPLAEP